MLLQNRYRLDSELGRGGMGVVYRAHDTLLDRAVAVKVLSDSGLGTEGRTRLLREAQAAAKLNHPNIVSVYDVGGADEADGAPFIVMELVEGQSLGDTAAMPLANALALARQICAALEHAHASGIIHRDLKPENIVLTKSQTVKLMDFGLARAADAPHLTEEGAIVGTFSYLAPELLMGKSASPQSDLYALGLILYKLMAGRPPFTGDNLLAVISQHLHAPVVPPSTYNAALPPALDALLLRLLSKQPEERPASAAEVQEALEHLDAAPAPAEDISPIDRIVRGRLVGRERELAEAVAQWRRAVAGEGGVLLISGEPGIGKTRLMRELIAQARMTGAGALVGECYAEGGAPYAPMAQIIQSAADVSGLPDSVIADLFTLAPELRSRWREVPPNPPLDPQSEQQRVFESVVKACTALAEAAPLLIVIDDAHWADGGTLFLLRHVARRARSLDLRLLIVLTYREIELDESHALNDVLADLNRERLTARIKLSRLNKDQSRDLLGAMFQREITADFLDSLYHETEGNPFFIEEVCKALVEEGQLFYEDGRWDRLSMDQIEIPQSVRVAIQSRVKKLPEPVQETLRLAAIIGREFDFDVLQKAGEIDEDGLVNALEMAEKAQLIGGARRAGRESYAFAHALIPATLRDNVSAARRYRLHRRAAAAIESLRPDDFESLAHHFGEAGEREKAIEYSRRAAKRAESLFAYDTASRLLRAALDFVEADTQPDLRRELLEQLADIFSFNHEGMKAIPLYQEATELWRAASDKMTLVRLHRKIIEAVERMSRLADVESVESATRASVEAGLRLVEGEPPHAETVRLSTALSYESWVHRAAQDWDSAETYARTAVALAEQLSTPVELSNALSALTAVYGARGLFRECVQVDLRRLALSQDSRFGDMRERVNILYQAGASLVYVSEYAQAMPHLLEAERLAGQAQDLDLHISVLRVLAHCLYQMDRWEQVLEIEDKWRALNKRYPKFFQLLRGSCFQLALNASVYARRGDFERAAALREESQAIMLDTAGSEEQWARDNHY